MTYGDGFAPGPASGISLRGLGANVDPGADQRPPRRAARAGRRRPDSFADLNQIPLDAVERIEVLKDGASAIYGSDAVAGVVNVILRRELQGHCPPTPAYGTSE